jgi:hypothetical protein
MWGKYLLEIIGALFIAATSSWITVRLSLRQFYTQQWWERKASAYERVMKGFHEAISYLSEYKEEKDNESLIEVLVFFLNGLLLSDYFELFDKFSHYLHRG